MRSMLSLVLEMIMTIDVVLLEVLFFPVVPVVQYTGLSLSGFKVSSISGEVGIFVKSVTSLWCGLSG